MFTSIDFAKVGFTSAKFETLLKRLNKMNKKKNKTKEYRMGTLGEALFNAIVFGGIAAIVGWIIDGGVDWAVGFDTDSSGFVVMFGMTGAVVGFFVAFMGDDDDD